MFSLDGKVIAITGGAGLLGEKHGEAVAEFGGIPIILDINAEKAEETAARIRSRFNVDAIGRGLDVTNEAEIIECTKFLESKYGRLDVLINNAANNPKVEGSKNGVNFSRLENFSLNLWGHDIAVGLTGAFLCTKHLGRLISQNPRGGSMINVASDLGLIAPDQRLYHQPGLAQDEQNVKPVTYSVVKAGLIGLTRYMATYWADRNVRCNAICPGGVSNNQDSAFLEKLHRLIPLGRMADSDEYKGIIVYLASDAASYMNGSIISIDGGRVVW